ncbi:MAG: DNA/RNA non-specific endonuclease [Crocinitomicaceae bacterium]|nr:DNA/RNA non-specific endonuclease [Crocinitomicaceae bacterium]
MKKWIGWFVCIFISGSVFSQSIDASILAIDKELVALELQKTQLLEQAESLKLQRIKRDLEKVGIPKLLQGDELVWHSAMVLAYTEKYEQPRWVAHIILPDVTAGSIGRTNDFRPDSLVSTGSAIETDYFLTKVLPDGKILYDGFGYDRGHLAPSADFRWSKKALSESYLYSNMSPQLADFNRGIWGDLEDKIREYVYKNPGTQLYVLTGPVLRDDLPRVERGTNKVAIPEKYWKVVLDRERQRAIGFIIPNAGSELPLEGFSVPIDSVESITGLDFFPLSPLVEQAKLESQRINADWFSEVASGDVEPIPMTQMKRGRINTVVAKDWMGSSSEIIVCGKVVGGRRSRAGNIILNLDKQYPNDIFSIFIREADLVNFDYDPLRDLKGKIVYVKGKVSDLGGKPVMYIERGKEIEIHEY